MHWKDKYKNIRTLEIEPNSRNEAEFELLVMELAQELYKFDPFNDISPDALFGRMDERAIDLALRLKSDNELTVISDFT